MRYHLAEAIRINGLPDGRRRAAILELPLGTRTKVAVLAKTLQGHRMIRTSTARAAGARDE